MVLLFGQEVGGGILMGLGLGWIAYKTLKSIDAYHIEVQITLALVMLITVIGGWLHLSGPIAVVLAGLLLSTGMLAAVDEARLDLFIELKLLADVGLLGLPNAGKSTLLNRMLGEKISITSRKPQTTRNRILGVVHRPTAQLVLIDTPGVHRPQQPLNVRIVDTALSALGDVDLILLIVDPLRPDREAENFLLSRVAEARASPTS